MNTRTEAERLAKRPYLMSTSIDLTTDGYPVYFAHAPELEGCFGQGETPAAAIQDLRLAMVDFIESLLVDGLPVPGPTQLSLTTGTASQAAYTFVEEGKKFQPKPSEANRASYILAI
jgi:predicted RNase H-like HicB family nuclease